MVKQVVCLGHNKCLCNRNTTISNCKSFRGVTNFNWQHYWFNWGIAQLLISSSCIADVYQAIEKLKKTLQLLLFNHWSASLLTEMDNWIFKRCLGNAWAKPLSTKVLNIYILSKICLNNPDWNRVDADDWKSTDPENESCLWSVLINKYFI